MANQNNQSKTFSGKRKSCVLVLEDGEWFEGSLLGHEHADGCIAEVVFNTSMAGYQEIITDPSYKGQMVCFTYPSIGNYGINAEDNESDKPYLSGIIVKDYCEYPSNFRSEKTLEQYMIENQLSGITGVDTRALVIHIRDKGAMMGGIFTIPENETAESWAAKKLPQIQAAQKMDGLNLAHEFSGEYANLYVQNYIAANDIRPESLKPVAVLDFGIKHSILKNLIDTGFLPEVFAGDTEKSEWPDYDESRYDGFFFSNGPGDPAAVETGIKNIRSIISTGKPVFGICLGHQMLSLALGAKTYKLKFGHHGGNQPVKATHRKNVMITAQNHGFAVDVESLKNTDNLKDINIDENFEINPNDNTVEGYFIKNDKYNIISVQYHPEAGPGPHDARIVFEEFKKAVS